MKKLIAFVRPERVERILDAFKKIPLEYLGYSDVRGYSRQKSHLQSYRHDIGVKFLPKVRLHFVVHEENLEKTLQTLVKEAKTSRIGDGKIFIFNLEEC